MDKSLSRTSFGVSVDGALESLSRVGFSGLRFSPTLEGRFEADTRVARSYRMWFEGLVAIIGFSACLILDYVLVKNVLWLAVLRQTAWITPVSLITNVLVRRNPVRWLREGSVAVSMVGICMLNLAVQGNATPATTFFGAICGLITALFAGVVMRLRFRYAVGSILAMLSAVLWSLAHARGLDLQETVLGSSLMVIGLGIILVACYSLEREERRGFLLGLQRDLQAEELAESNEALKQLSTIDKLTALPNRRALEERLDRIWEECRRTGDTLSAVVIDLDHFKKINDVYGHLFGDVTLQRVGALLPQALRSTEDMAARFGGEEFVLVLPHAEPHVGMSVAERARQLVETAGTPLNSGRGQQEMMWITVSCGVSSCVPTDGMTWTDMIAAADAALYAAKRGGRNRVEFRECVAKREAKDSAQGIYFDAVPGLF